MFRQRNTFPVQNRVIDRANTFNNDRTSEYSDKIGRVADAVLLSRWPLLGRAYLRQQRVPAELKDTRVSYENVSEVAAVM
jgi:hypothetical protein